MNENLLPFQVDLIRIQVEVLQADRHRTTIPVVALHIPDPVDLHTLKPDGGILFCRILFLRRRGKSVDDESIIPNGVGPAGFDHHIPKTDIADFRLIFQEEPVRQGDAQAANIKEGVFAAVPYQCTLQLDSIEKGNTDVLNTYLRFEHGGEPGRGKPYQPLLNGIQPYDQHHREQKCHDRCQCDPCYVEDFSQQWVV